MEISAKEARGKISSLLDRVEEGDEIIIKRRGKQVAKLVSVDRRGKSLPNLKKFRASIRVSGPLSSMVTSERKESRY